MSNSIANSELTQFIAQSLGRNVGVSHFSMARAYARELEKKNINLTIEQARVLFTLFVGDGKPQQEISDLLFQEKSSTSRLIDSLERKGYVQRRHSEHDERQKLVFLTPQGALLQDPCTQVAREVQEHLKEHFSPEEWTNLMYLTQKLSAVTRAL